MATIKEYATLSNEVYVNGGGAPPGGWTTLLKTLGDGTASGYYGAAYYNAATKQIVIAHRGTQLLSGSDLKNDWQILLGNIPAQVSDAQTFYAEVQNRIANDPTLQGATISHTGHSLGGAIARALALEQSVAATIFDPPGYSQPPTSIDASRITVYRAAYDLVSHYGTQVGTVHTEFVSSYSYVPDAVEPLVLLLATRLGLGWLAAPHFGFSQHSMDNLLEVINATNSGVNEAAVGLSVASDYQITGAWSNEWQTLDQTLQSDATGAPTGTLPEGEISSVQIRTEQNTDPATPTAFNNTGAGTLIVGENGPDLLQGEASADLLFGDDGADVLQGEAGNDYVVGGAGGDMLQGGPGNDYLFGGSGNDVYMIASGDGQDTLRDTDGNDTLIFNDTPVALALKQTDGSYQSPDGTLTFTQNSPLTVTDSAGTSVVLADYQDGDFGIRLLDLNAVPATTHEILGDYHYKDFDTRPNVDGPITSIGFQPEDYNSIASVAAVYTKPDGTLGAIGPELRNMGGNQLYASGLNPVGTGFTLHMPFDWTYLYTSPTVYYGSGSGDYYLLGAQGIEHRFDAYTADPTTGFPGNVIRDTTDPHPRRLDILYGGAENDHIVGGDGADSLYGRAGDDWIEAGITVPDLNYLTDNDFVKGGDGNDLIEGGVDDDVLAGEAGDDRLFANLRADLNSVFTTGATANLYHDWLAGGDGNDVLIGSRGGDGLSGGGGKDVIAGGAGDDSILGDADYLAQGSGWSYTEQNGIRNFVGVTDNPNAAPGGDDILYGGDGADWILGEVGNDALYGDAGDDYLNGDANTVAPANHGHDTLAGGSGRDTLIGNGGDDMLLGDADNDILIGDDGDLAIAYHGNDYLDGGSGDDFLFGLGGNDTLRDDAGDDIMYGGDGNDSLSGGTGVDRLWGEAGDDVLYGETGDYLYGGDGNDTLYGDNGINQLYGEAGQDVIYTGGGDDIVDGGTESDLLFGEAGNDTIDGGAGNDEIYGGAGNNTLIGGSGSDVIFGGPGNDTINGGAGDDTLDGGGGSDTFYLSTGNDTYANAAEDNTYKIAFGADITDDFLITLQDTGGLDSLQFETAYQGTGGLGPVYYIPALEGMNRVGNDLEIKVLIDSNLGRTTLNGTVRIVGQYTDSSRIETIAGLEFISKDSVNQWIQVSEETASQIQGTYLLTTGTNPYYLPYVPSSQYTAINKVLQTGGAGNDTFNPPNFVSGTWWNVYYGNEGDDTMVGGDHRDYLHGGPGNDRMEGKRDYDSYYIDPREGDAVFDDESAGTVSDIAYGSDTLVLPDGLAQSDLLFVREGNDLRIGNTRVERFFEPAGQNPNPPYQTLFPYQIEHLQGSVQGVPWEISDLPTYLMTALAKPPEIVGTNGDDGLDGDDSANKIHGMDGYDIVNSWLGDDIMAGGRGQDDFYDNGGNDTYLFNRGDADVNNVDTIYDYSEAGNTGEIDTLSLGGGIRPEDVNAYVSFTQYLDGSESTLLMLSIANNGGVIWCDWREKYDNGSGFVTDDYKIERLQFLGNDDDRVFNLADLVTARYTALTAATEQNPIPLFRSQDLTTFDITAQSGFAGGEYAVNYAANGLFQRITPNPVTGTGNPETLLGTLDADAMQGLGGNDTLFGATGNDTLNGGLGVDTLIGGPGNDIYIVDDPADDVRELLNEGTDTVQSSITYALSASVENLALTGTTAINGTGNSLNNTITGNDAANVLDGGTGTDTLTGGLGDDTYVVDDAGDAITENLNEGTDTVQSAITYILGSNVENLTLTGTAAINGTGNEIDNIITGNSTNNMLDGGLGDDQLFGGTGDDTYQARLGDGYDLITDTGGNDRMVFGPGINPSDIQVTLRVLDPVYYDYLFLSVGAIVSGNFSNYFTTITDWGIGNELNPFVGNEIETFIFDSGVQMTAQEIIVQPQWTYFDSDLGGYVTTGRTLSGYIYSTTGGSDGSISGTEENDILKGSATAINGYGGNDSLFGEGGNDVLNGGAGDDKLASEAGNDLLDGGLGADTMFGGTGNDTYLVDDIGDTVTENLNEGTDTVQSAITHTLGANVENLTLTGIDIIDGTGNELANTLIGNDSDNILTGGLGDDTLDGGAGMDYLYGNDGNDTLSAGTGTDYLYGGAGNDTLTGGASAGFSIEWLYGETGDDTLIAGSKNLTFLYGGDGNDTLIAGNGGSNFLYGEAGDDHLIGSTSYNNLMGGLGADLMEGKGGDDIYAVDDVGDTVIENANEGTDTVQSSITYTLGVNIENLNLTGTATINGTGNGLNNSINGNGNTAANVLTGLAGDDIYTLGSGDTIVENPNEGTDTVNSSLTYTLAANVENLTLTGTTAINGTGNELNNVLIGNSANNTLTGGAGNDTLLGNGGNDTLTGGTGADTMTGGLGNDTYVVDNAGDTVTENLNEGTDKVNSSLTYTLGANVENLTLTGTAAINGSGNGLANVITGNNAGNWLYGGNGNDTLYALGGTDWLYGGAGNDTLVGGAPAGGYFNGDWLYGEGGDDTLTGGTKAINYLHGGAGNDRLTATGGAYNTLIGDTGNDTLTGAGGADYLDGGAGIDTLNGGVGNDIYRFSSGYGSDIISDNDITAGNTDTVSTGVNPLDLIFSQSGPNLLMSIHGTTDSLNINSWYTGTAYQTEVFKAGDNSTLANAQVDQLIQAMAQFSASHGGITWDQAVDQNPNEVQAVLAAYWQPAGG